MIVTVTPTICDGTVVRWYRSESAAENGREMLSASREGVIVNGYLHEVPDDVLTLAKGVHRMLCRNRDADVQHLATHRKRRMFGPYEPITETQEAAG